MRRAALTVGWLDCWITHRLPTEVAIAALTELGTVDTADVTMRTRIAQASGARLFLPRPGDVRGHRSPDPAAATASAVIGLEGVEGISTWITAAPSDLWSAWPAESVVVPAPSVADADRALRSAIVAGAADLDELGHHVDRPEGRTRLHDEMARWGEVPLPSDRARLGARAVPVLLALLTAPEAGQHLAEQEARHRVLRSLDPAVRTAVEAAYSTPPRAP